MQLPQPLLRRFWPAERFQVVLVEKGVEVIRGVVVEVHVDGIAVNLVAEAAPATMEVILPLGHAWNGATLGDALRVAQRADGSQVGRGSPQPGADDPGDPELSLAVPAEAN